MTRSTPPRPFVPSHVLPADAASVRSLLERVGTDVGCARPDVQASLWLEAYARTLTVPLAHGLVGERRVPLLTAGRVAVTLPDGLWPEQLVLGATGFAALAGGPDADHRDAVLVEDDLALARTLNRQLVGHLSGPIALLASCGGRPTRALWRSVADRLAAALLLAAQAAGDVEDGLRLATAALRGPSPLVGRPDYRLIATPAGPMRLHARRGCCLWWRTRTATCCLTCPLSVTAEAARAA